MMKKKMTRKTAKPKKPVTRQTHGGIQQRSKLITFQKTRP